MFKLTEKAKQFSKFFVQHVAEVEDYDVTEGYASIEEAIKYEAQGAYCSEEEMAKAIKEYTPEEVLAAAESGYGWPLVCGYVEEVDEDEEESEMGINTTAPAKFLNFSREKLQFWLSDEPVFVEIKYVDVNVPEVLGNSLETAVNIVSGQIVPRILVQLSWGDCFDYDLNVPEGGGIPPRY